MPKSTTAALAVILPLGGVALAGGAALAVHAATSSPTPSPSPGSSTDRAATCSTFTGYFAASLGKSRDQVTSAFNDALSKTLADQVKAGKLTQTQADLIKQRAAQQGFCMFEIGAGRHGGDGIGDGGTGRGDLAAALGISEADLQAAFAKGQTVHQVAAAHGVTQDQLVSKLTSAEKTELDARVQAGRITQAQENTALAAIKDMVARIWDTTPPAGGHGHGRGATSTSS